MKCFHRNRNGRWFPGENVMGMPTRRYEMWCLDCESVWVSTQIDWSFYEQGSGGSK